MRRAWRGPDDVPDGEEVKESDEEVENGEGGRAKVRLKVVEDVDRANGGVELEPELALL